MKLIIFDFDGTIADTRKTIVSTMRQTLKESDLPIFSEEDCAATIGLPLKECFRSLLPGLSEESLDACAALYRRLFEDNKERIRTLPFPNVVRTLRNLREDGYLMSIATSRGLPSLTDFLNELGIRDCFDFLLGADGVQKHKPDPEPVLMTLSELSVEPSEALVVGDMPVDILMGKGAGCRTCGVTYGNSTREELFAAGADFVIDDFKWLERLLQEC